MMVYPLSNDQHINASIVDNLNIGVDLRKYKFDFKTIQNLSNNLINNEKIHTNLKVLRNEILLLKLSGAVKISDGKIITSDFGDYLCVIMMKEFYTGMDAIRAFFRDFSSKNKKEMMIKF